MSYLPSTRNEIQRINPENGKESKNGCYAKGATHCVVFLYVLRVSVVRGSVQDVFDRHKIRGITFEPESTIIKRYRFVDGSGQKMLQLSIRFQFIDLPL